jgi:phosphatidate cytidylyltransferase
MFLSRLFSTVVLLVIFFAVFFIKGPIGLTIFIIAGIFITLVCIREFSSILKKFKLGKINGLSEFFGVVIFLSIIMSHLYNYKVKIELLICVVIIILFWLMILVSINNKEQILSVIGSLTILLLLVVPLNFITSIYVYGYGTTYLGVSLILYLILVTKSGDIGAYAIGTLCSKRKGGNHKMVPSISPKKSWEGAIGGLIISVIVSIILVQALGFGYGLGASIILGIVLFIGGFFGDLAESSLKRSAKIKDSGAIIPGIGGALDLVDSLMINAPLFYFLIVTFKII